MQMTPSEIVVDNVYDNHLFLFCTFAAITSDWPETFTRSGVVYEFDTQFIMPKWARGQYGGYAKYKEAAQ